MTCKEKYMQEHPECNIESVVIRSCPKDFGYLGKPSKCYITACSDDTSYKLCRDCWNREIPETEETIKTEKENKEMCTCETIAKLKQENEELRTRNSVLAGRVKELEESWCKAKAVNSQLSYEHEELKKEYEILNIKFKEREAQIDNQVDLIRRKDAVINDCRTKLRSLNQTNEDLAEKLAAERAKVERLEGMVATRDEEIDKLVKEIEKFEEAIKAKNKRIAELCARIDKILRDAVIENLRNMASTSRLTTRNPYIEYNEVIHTLRNRIVELESKFKVDEDNEVVAPCDMWPKINPHIKPIAELPYARYASHIHMKYKALTDSGFSHDDAMSLIPMWDDNELEGFKRMEE